MLKKELIAQIACLFLDFNHNRYLKELVVRGGSEYPGGSSPPEPLHQRTINIILHGWFNPVLQHIHENMKVKVFGVAGVPWKHGIGFILDNTLSAFEYMDFIESGALTYRFKELSPYFNIYHSSKYYGLSCLPKTTIDAMMVGLRREVNRHETINKATGAPAGPAPKIKTFFMGE